MVKKQRVKTHRCCRTTKTFTSRVLHRSEIGDQLINCRSTQGQGKCLTSLLCRNFFSRISSSSRSYDLFIAQLQIYNQSQISFNQGPSIADQKRTFKSRVKSNLTSYGLGHMRIYLLWFRNVHITPCGL